MKKLILLVCVIFLFGCEQEGVVEIEECVETIKVKENSFKAITKTFTCTYDWTEKEDVHNGALCVSLELNKNNQCKRAYIYEKTPSKKCAVNSFLNNKGDCECQDPKEYPY